VSAGGPQHPTVLVTNTEIEGRPSDVIVVGNRIVAIEPHDPQRAVAECTNLVDGSRTAALPGLMNGHTHAAMSILRGYADDMPLKPWLEQKIWPLERKLTGDDVYWATRLGCLEMIRTGTTFFNDMYWHFSGVARAVRDAGLRALISGVLLDGGDPVRAQRQMDENLRLMDEVRAYGDRLRLALGPHSIYTVSAGTLQWVAETSSRHALPVHTHLAETADEVADCLRDHGIRPVAYLEQQGLLNDRLLAAHAIHLDDPEIELVAERGVTVLHCPASEMKLASGGPMRYGEMHRRGVNVVLGTDGAASNNSIDLFEEMKFAALMAKHASGDPTTLPAGEAIALATSHAEQAFRVGAGSLAAGSLADIVLVDLDSPYLFPGHDLAADLVYSAHGRAVTTTICDGQVLMADGVIADEADIRREVIDRLRRLTA
jgi:5-methylthioadenosine/S-adenosylhomocysteine deaminase